MLYWFLSSVLVSIFFFKQKTAYELRISDWSSDVCSSDLLALLHRVGLDHLLVSAISQHAEGVVGVRAEGLDGGDVLGHALHVPGHHVVDGALAELLLVVEVGVAVTEVDDAR